MFDEVIILIVGIGIAAFALILQYVGYLRP